MDPTGELIPAPRPVLRPRIVEVTVTGVEGDRVEVRLADGSAGAVDRSEFGATVPSVGSSVSAAVLARSDPHRTWLSVSWARRLLAWDQLELALAERTVLTASARQTVKGGVVLDLLGERAFLPMSLAGDGPVDLAGLVGTDVEVTVVELDAVKKRVVVSRREVLRRQQRDAMAQRFDELTVGSRVEGTVSAIRDHGVQVDLGAGARGMVHRSEVTWGRLGELSDHVTVGQTVEVVVLEVQRGRRRVKLSMRQLHADPFAGLDEGAVVTAVVTRVVEYGAFAALPGGMEGLIHRSELTDTPGLRADQVVVPGDEVAVKILSVDRKRRRVGLSVRQALVV